MYLMIYSKIPVDFVVVGRVRDGAAPTYHTIIRSSSQALESLLLLYDGRPRVAVSFPETQGRF